MSFFREIKDYRSFLDQEKNVPGSVTFYSGSRFYSQHFMPVVQKILEQSDLPIRFVTSDPGDPVFQQKSGQLSPYYCRNFLAPLIEKVKSRALVMTMPDLGTYHVKRALDPGVNHMYVFHAPASTTMMYRKGAFDHYDTIFCPGPRYKAEIRATEKHYGLEPKKLVDAGYYLLEKRYAEFLLRSSQSSGSSNLILVAPSWHDENLVEAAGGVLFQTLLDSGYNVVYRPHPQTMHSGHRRKRVEEITRPFLANPQFRFEVDPLEDDSFYHADVLITDWSSISLEYAWGTERPVVFIDTPRKVYNPEYQVVGIPPVEVELRDQIGVVLAPGDLARDLPGKLKYMVERRDEYRALLRQSREENIYHFGSSPDVIAREILDVCRGS